MTSLHDIYKKHISNLDNNEFIYKLKTAYYILTDKEKKLYEVGFKTGYELAQKKFSKKMEGARTIIGYQFAKPKKEKIDEIIELVSKRYEVNKQELLSKNRTMDLVRTRNILHNLFSEVYQMSTLSIGRIFNQDHTTVCHSLDMKTKRERYWGDDQSIWQEYEDIKTTLSE